MTLDGLSVLIPYRTDHGQRERLFDWVARRYQQMPGVEVCVAGPGDETPFFSRARAVNAAAARATRDVFLIADADVVSFPDALVAGMELLERGAAWCLPYNDYVTLDEAGTDRLLATSARTHPLDVFAPSSDDVYVGSLSGLALVSRDAFSAVGGFDERFCGFAPEDLAWAMAMTTLIGPPERVTSVDLYHLWHPFAPDADRNPEQIRHHENDVLFRQYQAAEGNEQAMRSVIVGGDDDGS